jgi:hypothetical protein
VSIWRKIKNAFIPSNPVRADSSERDGARAVEHGQRQIDGYAGDVSDLARVVETAESAPSPASSSCSDLRALADFFALPEDEQLKRFDDLAKAMNGEPTRTQR